MTATPRNAALDRLRSFVILLVLLHHTLLAYHPYAPPPAPFSAPALLWTAFPVVDSARLPAAAWIVGFNDVFFMRPPSLAACWWCCIPMTSPPPRPASRRPAAASCGRCSSFRAGGVFISPIATATNWRCGRRPESDCQHRARAAGARSLLSPLPDLEGAMKRDARRQACFRAGAGPRLTQPPDSMPPHLFAAARRTFARIRG